MKQMGFFVRRGADPQPYGVYGKGLQRRLAEKDAVSCFVIFGCDTSSSIYARGIVFPAFGRGFARKPDASTRQGGLGL